MLALRARRLSVVAVSTGQHRDLVRRAFAAFGLRAEVELPDARAVEGLNALSASLLEGLGRLVRAKRPSLVIVQGDTTSALMGALAAFHERVPVAHVEAGLRTFDLASPYPEEANRLVVDALADLHFAPTKAAAANLKGERASDRGVLVTGNTGLDALRLALERGREPRDAGLRRALADASAGEGFVLVTLHRRETLGAPLADICAGLVRLLAARPSLRLIWPVHLNPSVREASRALARHRRAHLLSPLDYPDAAQALAACRFVMTDSGGLQEEGPFLGKPVIVLRRVTERPEAVAAGAARVAGADGTGALLAALKLLEDRKLYARMAKPRPVFGDGFAAEKVAAAVERFVRR